MNPREKILAVAVALIVGLYGLKSAHTHFNSQVELKQHEIKSLEKKNAAAEKKTAFARNAVAKLKKWNDQSLPYKKGMARSLYYQWMVDQLSQAKFTDIAATAHVAKMSSKNGYATVTITGSAEGTLEKLTQFLYSFHSANFLHKIKILNVNPRDSGKEVTVNFTAEALVLQRAKLNDTLPSGISKKLVYENSAKYRDGILGRNLFTAYVPPKPPRPPQVVKNDPPPQTVKKPFDHSTEAVITGIVEKNGELEAWVLVRTTGERINLVKGKHFSIGQLEADVLEVLPRSMVIMTEGKQFLIELGDNLRAGTLLEGDALYPVEI